jgi:hypothetical protein
MNNNILCNIINKNITNIINNEINKKTYININNTQYNKLKKIDIINTINNIKILQEPFNFYIFPKHKPFKINDFCDSDRYNYLIQTYCNDFELFINENNKNNYMKLYIEIIKFGYIDKFNEINKICQITNNQSNIIQKFLLKYINFNFKEYINFLINSNKSIQKIKFIQNITLKLNNLLQEKCNNINNTDDVPKSFIQLKYNNISIVYHILNIIISNTFNNITVMFLSNEISLKFSNLRYDIFGIIKNNTTHKCHCFVIEVDGIEHLTINNNIIDSIKELHLFLYGINLLRINQNEPLNFLNLIKIYFHKIIKNNISHEIIVYKNYLKNYNDILKNN